MSFTRSSTVSAANFSLNRKTSELCINGKRSQGVQQRPFQTWQNLTRRDKPATVKEPKLLCPNILPEVGFNRNTWLYLYNFTLHTNVISALSKYFTKQNKHELWESQSTHLQNCLITVQLLWILQFSPLCWLYKVFWKGKTCSYEQLLKISLLCYPPALLLLNRWLGRLVPNFSN